MTRQRVPADLQMVRMLNDNLQTLEIIARAELDGASYVLPTRLMLTAYNTEIALKCLLEIQGLRRTGHNLKALFDALPEGNRDRIREIAREVAAARGRSTQEADEYFEGTLDIASDDFVTVRYVYEQVGGHRTQNLGPVFLPIYRFIFELRPEWREQYYLDYELSH